MGTTLITQLYNDNYIYYFPDNDYTFIAYYCGVLSSYARFEYLFPQMDWINALQHD